MWPFGHFTLANRQKRRSYTRLKTRPYAKLHTHAQVKILDFVDVLSLACEHMHNRCTVTYNACWIMSPLFWKLFAGHHDCFGVRHLLFDVLHATSAIWYCIRHGTYSVAGGASLKLLMLMQNPSLAGPQHAKTKSSKCKLWPEMPFNLTLLTASTLAYILWL